MAPELAEIEACYRWLEREIELVAPRLIVITVHPSMLLRIPDEYKAKAYRQFVKDLELITPFLSGDK